MSLMSFAKKVWKDGTSGGTPITAAEMNRIETGVNDACTQINALGDSVSQCATFDKDGCDSISFAWIAVEGNNYLYILVNGVKALRIQADFPS